MVSMPEPITSPNADRSNSVDQPGISTRLPMIKPMKKINTVNINVQTAMIINFAATIVSREVGNASSSLTV